MKTKVLLFVSMVLGSSVLGFIIFWACAQDKLSNDGWTPIKIESVSRKQSSGITLLVGSKIYFENGICIKSDLVEMQYIDQLPVDEAPPFLIFSGRGCDRCDMNTSIYILSPADGSLTKTARAERYLYPGKLFAFGPDHNVIKSTRLFIGNCIQGRGHIAAWFVDSKLNSGAWEKSVYIVEVKNGTLKGEFISPPLPGIEATLLLLHEGQCYEVPGKDMTEEP